MQDDHRMGRHDDQSIQETVVAGAARGCPVDYRYRATEFAGDPSFAADTVYVVGGLYGNIEALRTIRDMQDAEARRGPRPALVFNGDHNWFNIDPAAFEEANEAALACCAIRGNVETEIAMPGDSGCGCNYPDYVNAEHVARSNAIMARLQQTARDYPYIRERLGALPMHRTIAVGDARIGVVHGDAESLAGWGFAAERLSDPDRCRPGDGASGDRTPHATIERYFREAQVDAFACTHTCLAHARDYLVDGQARLIINNGAAGLPNFAGTTFGLVTRISVLPQVPPASLYGFTLRGARFDALPVSLDHAAWVKRFLANWPQGSPAHEAYFHRLMHGPAFALADAAGGGVRLLA